MKPTCYWILGMHRSGTSVLAGCLSKCGLETGKTLGPKFDNPKGFFENLDVLYLDEEILKYNNSSWDDISNIELKWTQDHLDRGVSILKEFKSDYLIKEPRMCILFKFWMEVFNEVGHNIEVIYIDRANKDICNSLNKRNGISFEDGEILCNKYKNNIKECDCNIIFKYFIENPIENIEFILDRYLNEDEKDDILDHIDIDLVHNTKIDV